MVGDEIMSSMPSFDYHPETPVGRVEFTGYLKDTWRTFEMPMRQIECYGMVYVLEGGGRYRDALGSNLEIHEGDLILLFPEIPHGYGPVAGGKWSEMFTHFGGPVFDLWRRAGLLDPKTPVFHQSDPERWRAELEAVLWVETESDQAAQIVQVSRFLAVLTQMLLTGAPLDTETALPRWLQVVIAAMNRSHEHQPMQDLAGIAGLPYHTFLRRFKAQMGMSPMEYRIARQIDAAKSMLIHTNIPVKEIADRLQFADEFHFSNRFKSIVGTRPAAYRKQAQAGTLPGGPTTVVPDVPPQEPPARVRASQADGVSPAEAGGASAAS